MEFAGKNFAYVSKKKLEKLKNLKEGKLNKKDYEDEAMEEIQEEEKYEDCDMECESERCEEEKPSMRKRRSSRGRCKSKDKNLRARSRSASLERNDDEELDEVYSCNEDEDENVDLFSKIQGGDKKKKKKLFNLAELKDEKKVFQHEVDTNVLTFRFNFLKEKVAFATGDPVLCQGCQAVFNKYSKLDGNDLWICEFCGVKNNIMIEPEEIPTADCIDYFVQSVNQIKSNMKNYNYNDEQSLIFCFDISGSMCVSTAIDGKHKFKGSYLESLQKDLMSFGDGSDQFYGNNKNITYVSRLQCLQAAIENNLGGLLKASPNRKIGIVTFNDEVTCYGDCTREPVKVSGNNLSDYAEIVKLAEKSQCLIEKPLKDTHDTLLKQLYNIQECGQTALGPAMLFSINMIKGISPGSTIILCTDGVSNLGLGALEGIKDTKALEDIQVFYTQLGIAAKEKGVVINLITFEEVESKIDILMSMIDQTGGEIIRVKPTEILNEFSNLLTTEVFATDVSIKVKLHKLMQFRGENSTFIKDNGSTLTKSIGNATDDTELYVEYCMKKSEEIAKFEDVDIEKLETVPFQSVIEYTNKSGDKCLRVVTATQKMCSEKKIIEEQAKYEIISTNAIKKTSKLAEEGLYREAQSNALAWKKMIKKADHSESAKMNYNVFNTNMNALNNNIQSVQYSEMQEGEKFDGVKGKLEALRKVAKPDSLSQQIHAMKNISSTKSHNAYQAKKK
jgi:hypothetical protein